MTDATRRWRWAENEEVTAQLERAWQQRQNDRALAGLARAYVRAHLHTNASTPEGWAAWRAMREIVTKEETNG